MNNLRQILVITKALEKEKEQHMHELSKTNLNIDKKKMLVDKMSIYLADYFNDLNLKISKEVPNLHINLFNFAKQIEKVITKTNHEIQILEQSRSAYLTRVQKTDQKLKLMNVFEQRVKREKAMIAEKNEQLAIDDITSIKKVNEL